MKCKVIAFSLVTLFIALLSSCSEEFLNSGSNNYDYYPLEVGNYVVYELDSFIYDGFTLTDEQNTYFVRELVESVFFDAAGDEVYRIERAYKKEMSDTWGTAGYDIWFASRKGATVEKIEENQRYIKLSYPLTVGKEWQGNIHINTDPINNNDIDSMVVNPLYYLDDWDYTIEELDSPYSINGLTFDSTVVINQNQTGTQIDTIGAREVYATGVGLIYKELWVLTTKCSHCDDEDDLCRAQCFGSSWLEKGEDGFVLIQEILSYGKL